MGPVREEEYKGFTVRVYQDELAEDPREWDNLGTMACFHRRYDLGDKDLGLSIEDVQEIAKSDDYISLPLYLMDHSGLCLSTRGFSSIDPAGWDWGQLGIIFVSKDRIREAYGDLTEETIAKAKKCLQSEVDMYAAWLAGDVFWYEILPPDWVEGEDPEPIDACGGYYATTDFEDSYLWAEVRRVIDQYIEEHSPLFEELLESVG